MGEPASPSPEYESTLRVDHTLPGWAYCTDFRCNHAVRSHLRGGGCTIDGCPCTGVQIVGLLDG